MSPEWLEYGAFGMLAVVLIGIGAGGKWALGRWLDNQKAALNHRAQADQEAAKLEAERRAAAERFLQDLMVQDRQERQQTMEAMQSLVAEDIRAKQKLSEALDGLCERQDRHEQRADERQRQMILLFEQQRKELS